MVRGPVQVRQATPEDVADLVEVWGSGRLGYDGAADPHEAAASLARVCADPDQQVLVAYVEGHVAGAVHLSRAPVGPLHSDAAVFVGHLQVLERWRRHGVGRAFVEVAVSWAEEKGTDHVITAATPSSRDANRFLARLGFAQLVMLRAATVSTLRARLPVETPAAARLGARSHRSVGQVLVQRRSMRRAQTRPS